MPAKPANVAMSGPVKVMNGGLVLPSIVPTPLSEAELLLRMKDPAAADSMQRVRYNPGQPRKWLRIDSVGNMTYVTADKHTLVTELSIPYRDLRMIDPLIPMPYPTALFIREKALVVNFESTRMIICKDQVLVLSAPSASHPSMGAFPTPDNPFIKDLVSRLTSKESGGDNWQVERGMPYELRALETVLMHGVKQLDTETCDLEQKAGFSLDRLQMKVSKKELENVKNVKSTLNRLLARVAKIKQVLEDILDDDHDMQDMYLARREEDAIVRQPSLDVTHFRSDSLTREEVSELARRHSIEEDGGHDASAGHAEAGTPKSHDADSSEPDDKGPEAAPLLGRNINRSRFAIIHLQAAPSPNVESDADAVGRGRLNSHSGPRPPFLERLSRDGANPVDLEDAVQTVSWTKAINMVDPHDIEECEDLLEAYFMQVDGNLSRLYILKERIEATEALISIDLDNRRNELVAFDLLLTIATVSLTLVAVIGSLFGMNLHFNGFNDDITGSSWLRLNMFAVVTITSCTTAVALFSVISLYAYKKRLLFIPGPALTKGVR
ncbi:hypothetical protein WJX72_009623 [[Myrmecia] bisecta]|uniref:Magnesium transporter n=1 Tax=[Myrmecia] bisecta TaxID=41462 RepID=A0AAW1PP28_9CHLO